MKKDIVPLPEEVIKLMSETSQETLRKYLDTKYPSFEEQKAFQRKNAIKVNLFWEFMENGKRYNSLRFAILKEYIFDKCNFEIMSRTYAQFLHDYGYVKTIDRARLDVIERAAKYPNRKIIVAIDGDNMSDRLEFDGIERHIREYDTLLHVVLFLANGTVNDALMSYEAREWLSVVYSKTNNRDAVDGCVGVFLGSAHASLSVMNMGSEYAFIVMTKDHFAEELNLQFKDMGRVCVGGSTFEQGMKRVISSVHNPSFASLKEETSSRNGKIHIIKILEKPTMRDMINLFRVAWLGSGRSSNQFCKAYGLDATNFSKHINSRKICRGSARRLLEHYRIYEASDRERSVFMVASDGEETSQFTIEHEWDESGLFKIRLDPSLFSLLCAFSFNSVVREYEPVAYIEQCTVDGQYFMSMYRLKLQDQSLILDTQCLASQVYATILTVPLKMRACGDVSLEIRLCDGQPELKLVLAHSVCSQYYTFTSMTVTEYAKQNIKTSIITNDIFSESDPPKTDLHESDPYTDWKRGFGAFQPFTLPTRNLDQVFFERIDLSKFTSIRELHGNDCLLKKVGEDYVVSAVGSLDGIETVCLSERCKLHLKKSGITSEEVRGTIYPGSKSEDGITIDVILQLDAILQ